MVEIFGCANYLGAGRNGITQGIDKLINKYNINIHVLKETILPEVTDITNHIKHYKSVLKTCEEIANFSFNKLLGNLSSKTQLYL